MVALLAAAMTMTVTKTGADVLLEHRFRELNGAKVALVTNHTAVAGGRHLIDVLHGSGRVKLVALFGPEHGLRGLADAGAKVGDSVDAETGLPVYSLYGDNRRPTKAQLQGCDMLVYDIQDVGARFYTYISTMGLCMQSAAEAGIPFILLDRPNPLGGETIEGPIIEKQNFSFVGSYPVPIRYGLTAGELALMVKGEKWLPGLENLDLRVIKMSGWKRNMLWPETGLTWKAPSPNVPDFETCLVYPGTCLFEATTASEGRGTHHPFSTVGAPGIDPEAMAARLTALGLEGVSFEPARFTPRSIEGMSASPKLMGKPLGGVKMTVASVRDFRSVATGAALLAAFYQAVPEAAKPTFFRRPGMARLAGTTSIVDALESGQAVDEIVSSWEPGLAMFQKARRKYLLYK